MPEDVEAADPRGACSAGQHHDENRPAKEIVLHPAPWRLCPRIRCVQEFSESAIHPFGSSVYRAVLESLCEQESFLFTSKIGARNRGVISSISRLNGGREHLKLTLRVAQLFTLLFDRPIDRLEAAETSPGGKVMMPEERMVFLKFVIMVSKHASLRIASKCLE